MMQLCEMYSQLIRTVKLDSVIHKVRFILYNCQKECNICFEIKSAKL